MRDKRKALIVVDVQNDFCPGGSLAVAKGDEVVAPINKLIKEFLDRGELVFKSRDWHPATAKHFAAYGGIWPVHCVQNTPGAEFHKDLTDDPRINGNHTNSSVVFWFGFAPWDFTLRLCAEFILDRLCFMQGRKANTKGGKKSNSPTYFHERIVDWNLWVSLSIVTEQR